MDTRTRWIVGILLALVIGLAVGLVIVAGDDTEETETVTVRTTPTERTESTTLSIPTSTEDTGGTPAPGIDEEGVTTVGGQGGL